MTRNLSTLLLLALTAIAALLLAACQGGVASTGDCRQTGCPTGQTCSMFAQGAYTCTSSNEDPVCGDGITSSTEECDDGNTSSGDGCASDCTIEDTPSCDDDILNQDEEDIDCGGSCDPCGVTSLCDPDPCQNGGVCADGADGFTCDCPDGFSGDTCATNIDDCADQPCQNGGVCSDGVNDFTCDCPDGFSGDTCAETTASLYIAYQQENGVGVRLAHTDDGERFEQVALPSDWGLDASPALATHGGELYMAFKSSEPGVNALWIARSSDGANFQTFYHPDRPFGGSPALASFNGRLYIAYQQENGVGVRLAHTNNGERFEQVALPPDWGLDASPALAVHNGALYMAFKSSEPGVNALWIARSSDGANFQTFYHPDRPFGGSPALTSFNGRLYIAYQQENGVGVRLAHTNNGERFEQVALPPDWGLDASPALATHGGELYMAFKSSEPGVNALWIARSSDGANFQTFYHPDRPFGGSPALVSF